MAKPHHISAAPKTCACGCGEPLRSNRSPYIHGHNPNTKAGRKAAAADAAPVRRRRKATKNKTARRPRSVNGSQPSAANLVADPHSSLDPKRPPVNLGILELWLNDKWDRMTLGEKVELVCGGKEQH